MGWGFEARKGELSFTVPMAKSVRKGTKHELCLGQQDLSLAGCDECVAVQTCYWQFSEPEKGILCVAPIE
jgi:hypothetical protein